MNTWFYFDGYDVHDKGDDTAYKAALDRVWVVGTGWGYSKFSAFANGTSQAINGTISCLKAAEASASSGDGKGSKDDEKTENDESSADDESSQEDEEDAASTMSRNLYLTMGLGLLLIVQY